jgi:hypothetical protein
MGSDIMVDAAVKPASLEEEVVAVIIVVDGEAV